MPCNDLSATPQKERNTKCKICVDCIGILRRLHCKCRKMSLVIARKDVCSKSIPGSILKYGKKIPWDLLNFEPLGICHEGWLYLCCNTCWHAYLGTLNAADYCDENYGQEDTGTKRKIFRYVLNGKKNYIMKKRKVEWTKHLQGLLHDLTLSSSQQVQIMMVCCKLEKEYICTFAWKLQKNKTVTYWIREKDE